MNADEIKGSKSFRALNPQVFGLPGVQKVTQAYRAPTVMQPVGFQFDLPYPPSANRYWRSLVIKGRLRVLVSAEARAYKKSAALTAAKSVGGPIVGPVRVCLMVYRPRRVGDLDNTIKVVLDALRGVAYEDDKQVVAIVAERYDDKDNPRVSVYITSAGNQ